MVVYVTVDDSGFRRKMDIISRGTPEIMEDVLGRIGVLGEGLMIREVPVREGYLKGSIDSTVKGAFSVTIQPHTTYSAFVNFGTKNMKANPFAERTAASLDPLVQEIAEQVVNEFIEREGLDI